MDNTLKQHRFHHQQVLEAQNALLITSIEDDKNPDKILKAAERYRAAYTARKDFRHSLGHND